MDSLSPICRELASPGVFQTVLSVLIIFGIFVSYLPQHIRIITRRSSFGISPYFILLGFTSGTSAFANILVFPKTAQDVACCHEIRGIACFAGLLGVFQMSMQWLSFFLILLLFVIYFPRATSPTNPVASVSTNPSGPTHRTAISIAAICVLHAVVTVIISVALALRQPSALAAWANFLGILAAILASIQYFPQIYTTLRLQCVGSLSIPMMCIQTPGSLVWAASLAAREGLKGWSIWGVLVVTASLQGTLLMLAIYFEYFGPNRHRKGSVSGGPGDQNGAQSNGFTASPERSEAPTQRPISAGQPSEETPLLQSQ
ncbi:uncharacterized protein N7483_001380 [Penicillium malachiteum]|uniref:uncharacterized protein n=1 Tax=Penicillium malachiteum TaxID=1324776 RepID=UPI0025467817|nr:uncharacterized protein N7483_001380 [Penicillium malachiteum]KAJ5736255.1 hypothetical protein N7483_001380 [Penicillium malachiteum]